MQKTILFVFLASISLNLFGKVDPANYNFELKSLDVFFPGKEAKDAGPSKEISTDEGSSQLRFEIKQKRFLFPVLAQVKDGKFLDFMARLPQYFSHDLFHQALINKLGKQDSYFNKDGTAVYQWKNKEGLRHIYAGACTITCFPIYYAVYPEGAEAKDPKPMLIRFLKLEAKE